MRQFGFQNATTDLRLHEWTHYCHIFSQGKYRAYVNGKKLTEGDIFTGKIPLQLRGIITLGQEQDMLAGAYDVDQSYRGDIAQLNIYSRSLSQGEIQRQASCQAVKLGDVFSSDREEMEVYGASVDSMSEKEFCVTFDEYVILPETRHMPESKLACKRIGYKVYSPSTEADNKQLHSESLQFASECKSNYHLWIGATDKEKEGEWRKFFDNEVIQKPPFELNEPNGGAGENCLLMFLPNGLWVDTSCEIKWPACVPCHVIRTTPLRLRGLCFRDESETFFETLGYKEGKPYLHGYYGFMVYRNVRGEWFMYDTVTSETVATITLPSNDSYPLGRHDWTLQKSICNNLVGSEIKMSISVCDNSDFSCSNGDCIAKGSRCNGKNDCTDFSDEDNCEMVVVPDGYRSHQPPLNATANKAILLSAIVRILRIVDINDVGRAINVELEVEMSWNDHRLKYLNLRDTLEWNKLTKKDISLIWKPKLTFPNVYDGNINTIDAGISLRKLGNPLPPDYNDVGMGNYISTCYC